MWRVEASEPAQSPIEEGRGVDLSIRRQDLGIGEPGGIIGGDAQEVPEMPVVGMHARPARQDAMTDAIDLA